LKYPNKIYLNIGGSIWQLAAVNGKIKGSTNNVGD
jgi:hypothetical protein